MAGAGMRRHVHSGNHAAESFVSFIPLFGGSAIGRLRSGSSVRSLVLMMEEAPWLVSWGIHLRLKGSPDSLECIERVLARLLERGGDVAGYVGENDSPGTRLLPSCRHKGAVEIAFGDPRSEDLSCARICFSGWRNRKRVRMLRAFGSPEAKSLTQPHCSLPSPFLQSAEHRG